MEKSFVENDQVVIFMLDELFYGIPLHSVVKVIHAIEVRNLSNSPEIISGIINVQGQIIPVVDIRKRLSLPAKEIDPGERMIIADTGRRLISFIVSSVTEVRVLLPGQFEEASHSLAFVGYISGVAKLDDNLVLIYDLEKFLSLDEEHSLDEALAKPLNE
jgi:purine-binding chemotaxis protein CheW